MWEIGKWIKQHLERAYDPIAIKQISDYKTIIMVKLLSERTQWKPLGTLKVEEITFNTHQGGSVTKELGNVYGGWGESVFLWNGFVLCFYDCFCYYFLLY